MGFFFSMFNKVNFEVILPSGQYFLWQEDESYYYLVSGSSLFVMKKDKSDYKIIQGTEPSWLSFFDFKRDYDKVYQFLSKDPILDRSIKENPGLKILNQDPYEALLEFIISSNNNMKRIKGCLERLARHFGRKITSINQKDFYALPRPKEILLFSEAKLRERAGLGYRAKYVYSLAKDIEEGKFSIKRAQSLNTNELYEYLQTLMGVGPKVASCVMLFAFSRWDAFPVDVWMERMMKKHYAMEDLSRKEIEEEALKLFYPYAGFAQQLLFVSRNL